MAKFGLFNFLRPGNPVAPFKEGIKLMKRKGGRKQ